jgi:quinol monooxygenase YgiN
VFAVVVRFHLSDAGRESARAAAIAVAALMSAVPGCLRFEVFEPDDEPGALAFSELWETRAAFEAHTAERPAPIAALAREIAAAFTARPDVTTYTRLA